MNEKMGMQEFTIKRTGKPPLRFTGELIGSGLNNGHENYEIVAPVSIYRTKGGKFVSVITYSPKKPIDKPDTRAASFDDAKALIESMAVPEDKASTVFFWPPAEQEAIEQAAEKDASIKAAWLEILD